METYNFGAGRIDLKTINWWKPIAIIAVLGWAFTGIRLAHSRLAYQCVVGYAEKNDMVINKGIIQRRGKV